MTERLTYFILTRKLFESPIWHDNLSILKLFLYLIGQARYRRKPKRFPGFEVGRGELVTSLGDISKNNTYLERGVERNWSRAKVSRMLKYLEKNGYIELLADTLGTHIRVCNYDYYQKPDTYKADSSETEPDSSETEPDRSETEVRTYNKDNNVKKGNNKAAARLESFTLPDIENIKKANAETVDKNLSEICSRLIDENIFKRAGAFKTTFEKKGKNKKAILHALTRTYQKGEFEKGAWGYAKHILNVENGNYNETENGGMDQKLPPAQAIQYYKKLDRGGGVIKGVDEALKIKAMSNDETEKRIAEIRAQGEKIKKIHGS
jgi:hypothetical protein